MIGQIDIEKSLLNAPNDRSLFVAVASVVNSLVDSVNALIKENNIHEKQIDRLQSTISKMEKVETPAENVQPDAESLPVNVPTNKALEQITALEQKDVK